MYTIAAAAPTPSSSHGNVIISIRVAGVMVLVDSRDFLSPVGAARQSFGF